MLSATRSLALMCAVTMLASPAAFSSDHQPTSIEVFTTSEKPASGNEVESVVIYVVDDLDQLSESLSENLPGDPEAAKELALQRIARLGDDLRWTVEHTVEGITLARNYDLEQVPAVVFDQGESVIYGVTDVNQALAMYKNKEN